MSAELQKSFQRELTNANRGHVAPLVPGVIRDAAGKTVWDIDSYKFLNSDKTCPPTVNEKLWRQGQLTVKQGLFEVVPGIYQLRSLDISNMTIVEGERGILVIDPLISGEPAAAGLELYRKYRDPERRRKVTGLVYTHSHTDHFGGAGGTLDSTGGKTGTTLQGVPIIAPKGFMDAVMSENLVAGRQCTSAQSTCSAGLWPEERTATLATGWAWRAATGHARSSRRHTTSKGLATRSLSMACGWSSMWCPAQKPRPR